MNTSKLLTVVIGLQALSLAIQFLGQPPAVVAPAKAQMPDSGAQLAAIIEELRGIHADLKTIGTAGATTAAKVDKIASILDSGKVQVHLNSPDENKRPVAGR